LVPTKLFKRKHESGYSLLLAWRAKIYRALYLAVILCPTTSVCVQRAPDQDQLMIN